MIGILKLTLCFTYSGFFFLKCKVTEIVFRCSLSKTCIQTKKNKQKKKNIEMMVPPNTMKSKVIDKNSEIHSRSLSKEELIISKNLWLHLNQNKLKYQM